MNSGAVYRSGIQRISTLTFKMIETLSICNRSALVLCILSMIIANNVPLPLVYAKQVTLQPAFTLTMMGARRGKGGNLSKYIHV